MSDNPQVKLDRTNSRGVVCENCQYFYNRDRPDVLRRLFDFERCGYFGSAVQPGDSCVRFENRVESTSGG